MSRYTCLPLPFYYSSEFIEEFHEDTRGMLERCTPIEPIFNRRGMYVDRKKKITWIETSHGAWIVEKYEEGPEHQHYVSYEEDILPPRAVKAIKDLFRMGIKPDELKEMLYKHEIAVNLRRIKRHARKWALGIRRKHEAEKL